MTFQPFPKMARLTRECVITEKIDGTNAQVCIGPLDEFAAAGVTTLATQGDLGMVAGSRNRYLTLTDDNFAFAKWVFANADALFTLGVGRHFGEWWGLGVQRGYGLTERRFSLFNTNRWGATRDMAKYPEDAPPCCHVVPVLYTGLFGESIATNMIARLRAEGSLAAPGFTNPEGIVIYHTAAGTMFKKTLEKDESPKGQA